LIFSEYASSLTHDAKVAQTGPDKHGSWKTLNKRYRLVLQIRIFILYKTAEEPSRSHLLLHPPVFQLNTMAFYYEHDEVHFEQTGHVVTVRDNDVACLMYDFNCVCIAIDCKNDDDIRRSIDHSRWSSLSADEKVALIALCYTFSPDVFLNEVFFPSDALCGDLGDPFYKIHQVRSHLSAAESIVIAGQVRHANQMMT
jgi:hypothetical protein